MIQRKPISYTCTRDIKIDNVHMPLKPTRKEWAHLAGCKVREEREEAEQHEPGSKAMHGGSDRIDGSSYWNAWYIATMAGSIVAC